MRGGWRHLPTVPPGASCPLIPPRAGPFAECSADGRTRSPLQRTEPMSCEVRHINTRARTHACMSYACMITHAHACAHKQKAAMGHQGAQPAAPRRHALPRPREGPRCPGEGTVHGTTAQKPSASGIPSHKPRPNTQGMWGTQRQPQGTHDDSVELPWRAMIAGLRERRPGPLR